MFARKFRLPATVPFTKSQFFSSPMFSLKVQGNEYEYNRFGFVVSKKISKRAHIRNRTKRRFRACVESLHPRLQTGYDMLFILKEKAVKEESQALCREIEKQLQKFLVK